MMAGEMATAMRLNLHIVFVVLMDAELSLITIKQKIKNNALYGTSLQVISEKSEASNHMFGVPILSAKNVEEYELALAKAFNEKGPIIIEVFIDPQEYEELVLKGNK